MFHMNALIIVLSGYSMTWTLAYAAYPMYHSTSKPLYDAQFSLPQQPVTVRVNNLNTVADSHEIRSHSPKQNTPAFIDKGRCPPATNLIPLCNLIGPQVLPYTEFSLHLN